MGYGLLQYILIGAAVGLFGWLLKAFTTGRLPCRRTSSMQQDLQTAATLGAAGQSLVYIARAGLMSALIGFDLELDGHNIATLRSLRYVRLLLPAGEHSLTAGPKGFAARANPPASLNFRTNAGEIVVFTLGLAGGTLTRNTVSITREPDLPAAMRRLANMKCVPSTHSA